MKEGNPKPAIPEVVSVEDSTSETENGTVGQGFKSADNEMAGQGFDTADNEMGGQSFDKEDNNSDEKPVLPRKSDEEAMKEGNPKPTLPMGVTVDDADVLSN